MLVKNAEKICFDCHEDADLKAVKGHAKAGNQSCLACHDPHTGQNKYLLKAAAATK
jgi:predicted CXXCH cytochrome family protein